MKTYEFEDKVTGEPFFVEEETEEKAIKVAKKYFEKPKCYGEVREAYADYMGYDTY